MYSQNQEEKLILEFFQKRPGERLLSIGENDGETFSNSRALIQCGWSAVLIEPDPAAFIKLDNLYAYNPKIELHKIAIGENDGEFEFCKTGSHLGKGDTGLLSTLNEGELKRFPDAKYIKVKVKVQTWQTFFEGLRNKSFSFVSIDAEGMDLYILRKMDFNLMKTNLVCVEWNSKDRHLYDQTMYRFNFKLINVNGENLIYAR